MMSQSPFEPGPACVPAGDLARDGFEQQRPGSEATVGPERAAFLAAIRDELHLPMNIFAGMGWLLQHSGLNPTQQHYLYELQSAGAHLLRIVERLLDDEQAAPDTAQACGPAPAINPPAVDAAAIAGLLPRAPGPAVAPWDEARWRALQAQLGALLDDADTACLQLAREHEVWLEARFGLAYESWTRALRDFDFELALQLLQAVGNKPDAA